MDNRVRDLEDRVKSLEADIALLKELVMGRNKSAPTKRNMTDADAVRVIVGDLCDMSHKDAAEVAGLTYSQVYSARMGFVFKHVHKRLRDSGAAIKWQRP
jgi:predicted Zn-dependent protease